MIYQVELSPSAKKQLRKLSADIRERILVKLEDLAQNPRPDGVKKLESESLYRVRVGSYRIIYEIKDDVLLVTIVRVGHRRDVYK
ncbi:MAG: type II toxin-antitoxin system RelE/ParE family toxin [Scytonema sp. PMC 1069.18]|nr:type II toxin-antitoxin system RelE/ParE family toxin [Scytonema sp. PMC 1069.18]